jgi:hypothetical protein
VNHRPLRRPLEPKFELRLWAWGRLRALEALKAAPVVDLRCASTETVQLELGEAA